MSKKHKKKQESNSNRLDGVPVFNPRKVEDVDLDDAATFCPICQIQCESEELLNLHKQQKIHVVNYLKAWMCVNRELCEDDKEGVTITCPDVQLLRDKSIPIQTFINKSKCIRMIVRYNGKDTVLIRGVDFLIDMNVATIYDDSGLNLNGQESGFGVTKNIPYKRMARLEPNTKYEFTITSSSSEVGIFYIPLAFDFYLEGCRKPFIIIRHLAIQFTNTFIESLENVPSNHQQKRKFYRHEIETIIPGKQLSKNPSAIKLHSEIRLFEHRPCNSLREIYKLRVWNPHDRKAIEKLSCEAYDLLERLLKTFGSGLKRYNYRDYFSSLLHIEELQMEIDIQKYDMDGVTLQVDRNSKYFYKLQVPGLRENRPSVLRGDKVYATRLIGNELDKVVYQGIVHRVENVTVTLGFNESFSDVYLRNMQFYVTFSFSRYPLRQMHQALGFIKKHHMSVLFPRRECTPSYSRDASFSNFKYISNNILSIMKSPDNLFIHPFNRAISINDEQKMAILRIMNGSSRPAPYLLFGPPGTGKTMTLVEAIKQIWHFDDESRILVCAPSNSACDTVAERLLDHIPKNKLLRLYASSRDPLKISAKIMKCCNYDQNEKEIFFPDKLALMKYNILITTLANSGRLVQAAFPIKHFTHIFIDEAGQSIEPESLIPITGLMNCQQRDGDLGATLVLAGDPMQLGPVLRSNITSGKVSFVKDSLATSLLERLMNTCDLYQRKKGNANGNTFDSRYLTKLVRNYRSHEAILTLPNKLFYDGELIASADKVVVNSLCNWNQLPRKSFPLIFHGVMGREKQESQSPSFYNPEEICIVLKYVYELLTAKLVQPREIGIISPYRKQVEKIKGALQDNRSSADITVGSTEEFQGQERRVIIISTVRSSGKVLAMDSEIKLGFLRNKKRFNVAVTRAKALLIVIGNPYVLIKDQQWGMFLKHCKECRAYTGCKFSGSEDAIDDLYERFDRLNCISDDTDFTENILPISKVENEESPQWPFINE